MFVELPMDDGIIRIETIDRVDYGAIDDDDSICTYDQDGPDTHYMVISVKASHGITTYEYTYPAAEHMYNAVSAFEHKLGMYA